jgi:hypothetical protein
MNVDLVYMFVTHIPCNCISVFLTDLMDDIGYSCDLAIQLMY